MIPGYSAGRQYMILMEQYKQAVDLWYIVK